jgi:CubicO group peptidase (beta-lactamase class C family)
LEHVTFDLEGERWTIEDVVRATATDGIAVLHRGRLVWERYDNGMRPDTRHLCFSMTKSIVATLAGRLIGRGALDTEAHVTTLLPELGGTSWEGATVRHVLDMRTGTTFSEVYEDPVGDAAEFGEVIGWFPRTNPALPADTLTYLAGLPADRRHGGAFDYRTPVTSMLAWLCERAGGDRLAAQLSREVWAPMGAEFDAWIAVDAIGTAFGGGGFCATLRDMVRFGEMWRLGGVTASGVRIVPESWVRDTLAGGPDSRDAWAAQVDHRPDPAFPDAFYRNKWWIHDPSRRLYSAIGIHGQFVTVDGEADLVVARFSSQPVADDETLDPVYIAAVGAIAAELSEKQPAR